jgi:DNA end-binding protein Ku
MAENLITAMKVKFDPKLFKDEYQTALNKLIDAKLKGVDLKESVPSRPTAVVDLMAALQASLNKAKKGGANKAAAATSVRKKASTAQGRKRGAA